MKDILNDVTTKVADKAMDVKETAEYFTSGKFWDEFVMNCLAIVLGIILFIVLFNALFNGIYRLIRGLDVALLGGVFVWAAIKVHKMPVVMQMSKTLLLLGLGMIVLGILIFIIFRKWEQRKKRRAEEVYVKKEAKIKKKEAVKEIPKDDFPKPVEENINLEM